MRLPIGCGKRKATAKSSCAPHNGAVQRVVIVGPGGAGKSTLARRLAARSGLPLIHLDEHFWHPGWIETPRDTWRMRQRELFAGDAWIADGNYSATLDERLPRADTVIFLDFPVWRTIPRALRRSIGQRGTAVQAEGCPERVDVQFLRWIANYRRRSRPVVLAAIAEHAPQARVHVLRNPRAVDAFVDAIPG
jgi:adenylate kinase family enzyme